MVLAIVALGGCGFLDPSDPVVDGWPIGESASCAPDRCDTMIRVATEALDAAYPDHAPVSATTIHREGTLSDGRGGVILTKRSGGCCTLVVFGLADGSTHAIGVGGAGIDPTIRAIVTGP